MGKGENRFLALNTKMVIPLNIENGHYAMNITEITEHIKFFISTEPFDTLSFCQKGIPFEDGNNMKALGDGVNIIKDTAPDWMTRQIAFRVIMPKFLGDLGQGDVTLNKDKALKVNGLSAKIALCSDEVGQYWMGAPLIPAYQKAESYPFKEGLASVPPMTVLALFDVQKAEQVSKKNPLKITLNKPITGVEKIVPIGFSKTKKDYFPIGKQINDTTIEIYEIPNLVKPESAGLTNLTCIFFKKMKDIV